MIKFIHNAQIVLMIAILAISFFITYDFFITHISFKPELFLASTILVFFLAAIKFLLKFQIYLFVKKNKNTAEIIEPINQSGKKRLMTYDALVWIFMLALALFQTKLFGLDNLLTISYYFALFADVFFWIAFQKQFQTALISGQLMIFNSRPNTISLKNIRTVEKRFDDYYINYNSKKFALLKSDLLTENVLNKVSVFFEKTA